MTRFENEGYRPQEGLDATLCRDDHGTLTEDHPVTGDDLYRAAPLSATVSSDEIPTIGEGTASSKEPPKKSRKRIVKAIKMLTSAVATVAVAATLTGSSLGEMIDDFVDHFTDYQELYPHFMAQEDRGYSFSEHAENANFLQACAGDFGIRIENNVVTVKDEKNKYGQFMRFEMMTFVPIDLDAIDPEELTKSEREWLNDYHRQCYEKLSPYMTDEENEWLREYTRAV